MDKKHEIIYGIKALINDPEFQARHKMKATYFTRKRVLVFPIVLAFILQKSVKSLQLVLNEGRYLKTDHLSNSHI